nr:hypothetical protein [Tanacetum cinerariifolium]
MMMSFVRPSYHSHAGVWSWGHTWGETNACCSIVCRYNSPSAAGDLLGHRKITGAKNCFNKLAPSVGPYLLNYQEFRMTGPTPITLINRTNTNTDQDGSPDLQDQILSHISSLKTLVQKHNESPTGLLKPIRLSFDNEDVPANPGWTGQEMDRSISEECIDNWTDLHEAFVERFALGRKCCKDPSEVAKIISAFMSNSKCPELARRFSDQVPQIVAEMIRRVDDFVKSEEVFKNTELPKGEHPERPAVTQFRGSRPPRHSYGSRPSRPDICRKGDHYQPYVIPRAPNERYDNRRRYVNHLILDSLTKLPSEILATELQLRLPPCPPTVAPPKKENLDRYCEYHGEKGHYTNDCFHLKEQLEIALESKKLNHLIKDVRQRGGDRGRQTVSNNGQRKVIKMVRQSYNGLKHDVSDGPLIVEAEVEGCWIRRVFVDQGAVVQVMFEHYFDNLSPGIKARLAPTQTELVGFSGEQLIPIGKIKLKVVKQEETIKETEETMNQSMEEEEKVFVNPVFPEQTITIGTQFSAKCREQLVCLLKDNMDVFAWQPSDMGEVPRRLVRHALNVNHSVLSVAQKRRVLGTEKSKLVTREVEEWIKAGIVRPVKYLTWISNPVLVKKADDTQRMCIDFKNLNSACTKDYYPLPKIDLKIEAVRGHPF